MPLSIIALFLLPLLEIAGFVVVGREIGALATVGLVILSTFAGMMVLRLQGFGIMATIRAETDAGRDPGGKLADAAMVMLAGVLLLIPGFVTDILALLLLIPPVRRLAWRFLKSRVNVVTDFSTVVGGFRRTADRRPTIDLDEDEYSRRPDPNSPWLRKDDRS